MSWIEMNNLFRKIKFFDRIRITSEGLCDLYFVRIEVKIEMFEIFMIMKFLW